MSETNAPEGEPAIRVIAMPADANPNGDIFGGWLMAHMDLAGATAAQQRSKSRVATVAVDSMSFIRPVKIGDEVSFYARLLGVGRTSMRVMVEAWRRPRAHEHRERVTSATFVYVALDEDRRPRPVDDA
jgi:acyl-CoA thioesterase YciA